MIHEFWNFLQMIYPDLVTLFTKVVMDKQKLTEEEEKQLAMNIIRKAKDEQARREIEG